MGEMFITIHPGEPDEYTMPFAQAMELGNRLAEFENPVWHPNNCGCCLTVHEHSETPVDRAYIIGPDGGVTVAVRGDDGQVTIQQEVDR